MQIQRIPFDRIPQFSDRDVAYAQQAESLRAFYKYEPSIDSFEQVIADKSDYPSERRRALVAALEDQYAQLPHSDTVASQIRTLAHEHTYTVVTAHQPSLFTGPLYFIYKIASAINLANQLNERYPDAHIVPVFITGGEDHDFEEINHAHIFNDTVTWQQAKGGSVGQLPTESLQPVLAQMKELLGSSDRAVALYEKLEATYGTYERYGMATIAFVHDLFQEYGLVILDMNRSDLKQHFASIMREELIEQPSQQLVQEAQQRLEAAGYGAQAHAREINLFYLGDGYRERIVQENGSYEVLNQSIQFSPAELVAELEAHPERFSPNVVMRPLYQECILPNLAYIGGGGELAYWLERKAQFEHFGLNFPMLIRRNSVLWIDRTSVKKLDKLDLRLEDLLEDTEQLIKRFVQESTDNEVSLAPEKAQLQQLFERIATKAEDIDPTLKKAVLAEHARQEKAIDNIEGRLMRAEKQRFETSLNQIRGLKDKLFPNNGLQERHDNFIPFFLKYDRPFLDILVQELDPLTPGMVVVYDGG